MAPLRKPAVNWKRPFTCVYGDNYAYGFNSYKDVMEWLDNSKKDGYQDELPPSQMPTLEERAANHMRYKLGRSQSMLSAKAKQNEEYNCDPLTLRLNRLKKASGWIDERKQKRERRRAEDLAASSAIRRAHSYGSNFASKAADEISAELADDSLGIGNGSGRKETPKEQRLRIQKRIEEDLHRDDFGLKRDEFGATSGRVTPALHSVYQKIGEFDDVIDSMLDMKLGSTSRKHDAGESELKGCCKQHHTEMEQMKGKVRDAEDRLRNETLRLRKQYETQIVDLEKRLDSASLANLELQKTAKRQATQNALSKRS